MGKATRAAPRQTWGFFFFFFFFAFLKCFFFFFSRNLKLKVSGPGQLCLVLANLIRKSQAGTTGAWDRSELSFRRKKKTPQADFASKIGHGGGAVPVRRWSCAGPTPPGNMREGGDGGRRMKEKRFWMSRPIEKSTWEQGVRGERVKCVRRRGKCPEGRPDWREKPVSSLHFLFSVQFSPV